MINGNRLLQIARMLKLQNLASVMCVSVANSAVAHWQGERERVCTLVEHLAKTSDHTKRDGAPRQLRESSAAITAQARNSDLRLRPAELLPLPPQGKGAIAQIQLPASVCG